MRLVTILFLAVINCSCSSALEADPSFTVRVEMLEDKRIATIMEEKSTGDAYAVINSTENPLIISAGRWKDGAETGSWARMMPKPDRSGPFFLFGTLSGETFKDTWAMIFPGESGRTLSYKDGKAHGEYFVENRDGSGAVTYHEHGKLLSSLELRKEDLPKPKNGLSFSLIDLPDGGKETGMTDSEKKSGYWVTTTRESWSVGKKENSKRSGLWFQYNRKLGEPVVLLVYDNDEVKKISLESGQYGRHETIKGGKTIQDSGVVKISFE